MDTYLIGRGQVFPRSCVNKLCFFSSVASFSTKVQIRMKLVRTNLLKFCPWNWTQYLSRRIIIRVSFRFVDLNPNHLAVLTPKAAL
jgi:hypothetical protein